MKKRSLFALLLIAALALTACAQQVQQEPVQFEPPKAPSQTEPAQPAALTAPAAAERPEVESNGGEFVRVDDQVWFRRYDDGAIDETQLWGDFLKVWPSHPVTSTLCYYDELRGAVVDAMTDDGFGALWFGVDGFYLSRPMGGADAEAYFKTLDGTETVLGEGRVAGVSDNGRFAAVQNGDIIRVFEGTEGVLTLAAEADFVDFCAVSDDGTLVYYTYDYDANEGKLDCLDADGHEKLLGFLPDLPEDIAAYSWEFEQCLLDGDDVWCTFGVYEGTGHFLAEPLVVHAKLNTQDSLDVVEDEQDAEYPYVPKLARLDNGELVCAEHAPGELEITYEDKDLWWYETAENGILLVPSFLPVDEYSDFTYIAQSAETMGGAAYIIVAEAYRDEDADIGWRTAYAPGALRYLRVPLDEYSETEALDGGVWETLPSLRSVYEPLIGTWVLTGVEVEGDRSDDLPDGMFEVLTFLDDGTVILDSAGPDPYHNEFTYAELLPAGDANNGYGILMSGGENEDMFWAYCEGKTMVGTLMLNLETENGVESVSRTGFYEHSAG